MRILRTPHTPTFGTLRATAKKGALLTTATALAVTGVVAGAGSAQAAGPDGSQNVRGVDPGDTDAWLDRLCRQKPEQRTLGRRDLVYGSLNVKTGEFRTSDENFDLVERLGYAPGGDWEYFSGKCTYPESSSWSIKGKPERTSEDFDNESLEEPDEEWFTRSHTSTTSYKKSIGGSLEFSLAKSIFTGTAGGSFNYEWGWEKTATRERRSVKTIPPCSQIHLTWQPYQRVVRVNPVFNVVSYSWNKSTDPDSLKEQSNWTVVDTWRGRGASWKKIYSYGLYIDGVSDKVLSNGEPAGKETKHVKPLDPETCH